MDLHAANELPTLPIQITQVLNFISMQQSGLKYNIPGPNTRDGNKCKTTKQ